MSHLFDQYRAKHGHGPRLRIPSGVQMVTVEFSRGYVRIKASSPLGGEIYLTRSAWFKLLVKSLPITRLWRENPAKDWDVPRRMQLYLQQEQAHLEELRAQKRARKQPTSEEDRQDAIDRRRRQKVRHERAVRRRLQRESEE